MRMPLKKFRTTFLCLGLFLAALLLYTDHLRQRPATSLFHRILLQATSPIQGGLRSLVAGAADLWTHYLWLVDTSRENDRLLLENRELRAEVRQTNEVRLENERLKKLLDFRETTRFEALPSRVVAEDASSWFRTILIDKGSEQGVGPGMPVVTAEGVVGRTFQVSAGQSRVLLATDASSSIAATLQKSRSRGMLRGLGNSLLLDYVDRDAAVAINELVLTSGTGGVFPKGIVIGRVQDVRREDFGLFQSISVRPSVDFSRIEEVLVLLRRGA